MNLDILTVIALIVVGVGLAGTAIWQILGPARRDKLTSATKGWLAGPVKEWLVAFLQKFQGLIAFIALVALFYHLKIYLNDHIFSDWWFHIRQDSFSDYIGLFIFPLWISWAGTRLCKKYLPNTRVARNLLILLVLPVIAIVAWYPAYRETTRLNGSKYRLFENGKVGCWASHDWPPKDSGGPVVVKALYDDVDCFALDRAPIDDFTGNSGDRYVPVKIGKLWGFLDSSLDIAIQPQYENYWKASWGLIPVKKGGKWGFIAASTGEIIIPFMYDGISSFAYADGMPHPMASVKKGDKWGFIDRFNRVDIPFLFDDTQASSRAPGHVHDWNEGNDRSWEEYKQRIRETGSRWQRFKLHFLPVHYPPAWTKARIGDKWGVIDSNGRWLLAPSIPPGDGGAFLSFRLRCDAGPYRECFSLSYKDAEKHNYQPNSLRLAPDTEWVCTEISKGSKDWQAQVNEDGHVEDEGMNCNPKGFDQ
jgi:hypothetical protein